MANFLLICDRKYSNDIYIYKKENGEKYKNSINSTIMILWPSINKQTNEMKVLIP